MRLKAIIFMVLLTVSTNLRGQPPETIYQGNVIASGFRQSIPLGSSGPFPLGFNFTFFGNTYTSFYVSANGLVMFTAPDGLYNTSVTIPTATSPNNYIAPFWDNLSILETGKVMYKTVGTETTKKCIIQFKHMGFDPVPTSFATFQVILYQNGEIQVQYRVIIDPYTPKSHGLNATIGLENAAGDAGVLYKFHDGTAVYSMDAIRFTPSGGTYTTDDNASYDAVFLTPNISLPEPGQVDLLSPSDDAVVGTSHTFEWSEAENAASYILFVDVSPDLSSATSYDAGTNLTYDISGLTAGQTYYWAVFAQNATGLTWCEVSRFSASDTPPLTAIPREIWVAQGNETAPKLQYSGGDASSKSAIVTSLPSQGELWQVSGGVKSTRITTVPATVTDAGFNLVYVANGSTGNGAGSFDFKFHDDTGDSPEALFKINVNPPGIPNLILIARSATVELQFDRKMNDPAGKESQFTVQVNGSPVTISSVALKSSDPYSIILTVTPALTGSETVLVSYTKGDISATTGGLLNSFIDQPVTLLAQTITFPTNLNKTYGNPAFSLSASSSAGLTPFTYSSSNLTVATIASSTLTIRAAGTSEITALQAGNATYAPARNLKILTVAKADQTITFNTLPPKETGDPDFSPGATASSGLSVSYTSSNPSVATITGSMIHITGDGITTITASQAGNTNYNAAVDVPQELVVSIPTAIEDPLNDQDGFIISGIDGFIRIRTTGDSWQGRQGSVRMLDISGRPVTNLTGVEFSKDSYLQVPVKGSGFYIVEIRSGLKRFVGKVVLR